MRFWRHVNHEEFTVCRWKRLAIAERAYLKRPATHLQRPPQWFGPLMSEEDFWCAVKGVLFCIIWSLWTRPHFLTLHPVVQSAHLFKDFVYSGIPPLTAHRKSSLLVRGPNHCGSFCRCVAGLFKESNSLFCDGERLHPLSIWIKFCFSYNARSILKLLRERCAIMQYMAWKIPLICPRKSQ